MALFFGALLLSLGFFFGWLWWDATLVFLKGILAFSFVVFGLGTLVVGVAATRAKGQIKRAKRDAPSTQEKSLDS